MSPSPDVQSRLGHWKNQLIDTTKRNRLLFFRSSKSGSIRLTDPDPESIFETLVRQERPLTLLRRDDLATEEPTLDLDLEVTDEDDPPGRALPPARRLAPGEAFTDREDQHLNTLLYRLRLRSRTAVAEQGVNILFVAFGVLQWIDPAKSEERSSPLILVPVALSRETSLTPYRLVPIDEEVILNPTLAFLLERDCHLSLPSLPDDLDTARFDEYCQRLDRVISGQSGWSVRREVHLGTFSFAKLVIYKDLDTNTSLLCSHPLVRALAGDTSGLVDPEDLPQAQQLDDLLTPEQTFQVLDSDSSQHESIEAAKRGVSLVLQGPPGTGKSQTIANLIAEMLAAGKRVLFVSEKMAALQVVHKRLKARKLDDFCLEVHSAKASKTEVLKEIGRALRLKEQPVPSDTTHALSQLGGLSRHLNAYVQSLHTPYGAMGWTPFYVHGQLAAVHSVPELNFGFTDPAAVNPERLAYLDNLLLRMEGVRPVINGCETHPWRGSRIKQFSFGIQTEIHERFTSVREELDRLAAAGEALGATCHLSAPTSVEQVDWLLRVADMVRSTPRPPVHWFSATGMKSFPAEIKEVEGYQDRFHIYLERKARLVSRYREGVLALNAGELRTALTEQHEGIIEVFRRPDVVPREALWPLAASLGPLLQEAVTLLGRLSSSLDALSLRCGVVVQPTRRGVKRLLALTTLVSTDPRPTVGWFDRTRLRAIRDRARRASEVYPALETGRARLLANYDAAILDLDLEGIIRRFSTDYVGLTRIMRPSYWQEMRMIRGLQRMPGKLTVEGALADLRLAREVRDHEQWVRDNQAHLDEELGTWFKAHETAWPETLSALETVGSILEWFGQSPPSPPLVQVLQVSGAEIGDLQRLHEELTVLAARGGVVLEQILRFTNPPGLPFGAGDVADVELNRVREWLSPLQAACLDFWSAGDIVKGVALHPDRLNWEQAILDLEEVLWLQREGEALARISAILQERYGHFFEGAATDWQRIVEALVWTGAFQEHFGEAAIPEELVHLVCRDGGDLGAVIAAISPCHNLRLLVEKGLEYVISLFTPMITDVAGGIRHWDFGTVCSWLDERIRRSADLEHWIDFRRIQCECETAGLEPFMIALMLKCPEESTLRDLFYRRFYRLWLDKAYGECELLGQFRGRDHDRLIQQFRDVDRSQWERLGPVRVRQAVLSRRQPIAWPHPPKSEPWILSRELEKRRRHKPLRQLFAEIPSLLQELKPCLLMSPMTVSQLLDPQRYQFDLVIFDEASQICAEDAVGAIYRGKQIVVAGDRHQLPPTRFFSAGLADAYDGDEEEAADEEIYESILDQCRTMLPIKPLKWHYRSRHESLIAFSNVHIYSKDPHESLKTFPSARDRGSELGIELVRVPNAVYDRKKTRRNPVEAARVAELVIRHMQQSPGQSLGVVAFSEAQQLAILAEVERLRRHYPELNDAFDENRPEPFFVKNLENVQGDERDVIFLNIGYGKDATGALSLNFGPLNRQGGERRLNVAVTRAKYHLKLITSLSASDIDLSRTQSRGVPLLRAYLEYAERGPATLERQDAAQDTALKSAFEDAVKQGLENRGYRVVREVGYGGYRVDLAIQDPDDPGRYLLGIECDGREYASAATARDRDRLSTTVLAGHDSEPGLGWKLHRLWSSEWIKDPERELNRIEEALERSRQAMPSGAEPASSEPDSAGLEGSDSEGSDGGAFGLGLPNDTHTHETPQREEPVEDPASAFPTGVIPYQRAVLKSRGWSDQFYGANRANILHALKQVVAVEGPLRLIDATRRVAAAWEIRNAGRQVQAIVAAAAEQGVRAKHFSLRDGFLWPRDMETPPVRTHEGGEHTRKIEEICDEEIEEAALLVIRQSFSLPEGDLIIQTARTLGFGRTGAEVRDRVAAAVDRLVSSQKLTGQAGLVCYKRE